ncbi:uncharacterized protein LOC144094027 [Amblyomma americanum]
MTPCMNQLSGTIRSGENPIRRRCLTQVTLPQGKLKRTTSPALLSNHGHWPSCFGHTQQQLYRRPDSATPMHLLPDAGRVRRFEPANEFLVAPGISPPNGQFRKAIIFALWSAVLDAVGAAAVGRLRHNSGSATPVPP